MARAKQMVEEGADVIEVGAQSARPGARPVSGGDEKGAVTGLIKWLVRDLPVPISVDTDRAEVAEAAIEAGASIVNDISSLADPGMAQVLRGSDCGVVLMHMRGSPQSMQRLTDYRDVAAEVTEWLRDRCRLAESEGISKDRIAVDPGLGLAKNRHGSLALVNGIRQLAGLGYPVMIAASRKSFIGRTLNQPPAKRLMGSLAVAGWAVAAGAALVRVHDVLETVRVVRMTEAIMAASFYGRPTA